MSEFAAAEATETEVVEVGEMAVAEGPVTVEFIGFEAVPELQAAPEAEIEMTRNLTVAPEAPPSDLAVTTTTPITTYLEASPPLEVPAAKLQLVPPDGLAAERPSPVEANDSPAPRPRRGTTAYAANRWERAA
jgi:hypothetical protein